MVPPASHGSRPRRQIWSHCLLGPTTLHLQHEFFLWLSLSLLVISNLQGVYRQSFGLPGDYCFSLVVSIWLSRPLLLRWLVTTDTSTTRSPTFFGVLAHGFTSIVMAGQYCDRPSAQVVARQIGSVLNVGGGDDLIPTLSVLPALLYLVQLFRIRFWYPFLTFKDRFQGKAPFSDSMASSDSDAPSRKNDRHHHVTTSGAAAFSSSSNVLSSAWMSPRKWVQVWILHGPPLQLGLIVIVGGCLLWNLVYPISSTTVYMSSRMREMGDESWARPRGLYRPMNPTSWLEMFFMLATGPTLASILMYGRITLPIPNLVAGTSVLKAVRKEARLYGASGTHAAKISRKHKDHPDTAWAEQQRPIATENRFRLVCKVTSFRVLDALSACVLIPRTIFACRKTGHCSEEPVLWELAKTLYPVGLTGPLEDQTTAFSTMIPDRGAALVSISSVVVVTVLLLLAQLVVLDKSYLAIMGYISGGWTRVDDHSSIPRFGSSAPAQWDPRRRYKKGDYIIQSGSGFVSQTVYMATSNSPEGRPFNLFLRASHDLFRNELGHPSTSQIIAVASRVHFIFMGMVVAVLVFYMYHNYPLDALLTALLANVIAAYGIVQVGTMDHSELTSISQEIGTQL